MFSRILHLATLAIVIVACAATSSAAVRLGTVTAGFGYFNGPFYGPYCCYSPWVYGGFYGPFWGPFGPYYPASFFSPAPNKGTVKLIHANRDAAVYIDNAYAGKVSELKSINIEPGAYDLELRPPGEEPVQKRIYVLSGKTLKLEF